MASVWFGVVCLGLGGLFALMIDSSQYYYSFHQLQAAADSAALAGLDYLSTDMDRARQQAKDVAAKNLCANLPVTLQTNRVNNANGDIVLGTYDSVNGFRPLDNSYGPWPNAVKVNARRTDAAHGGPIKLMFGWLGGGTSQQTASAIGVLTGGGAGLVTLSGSSGALQVASGATIDLGMYGGVQVDSTSDSAASISGQVMGTQVVVGGNGVFAFSNASPPPVKTGVANLTDPVGDVPEVGSFGNDYSSNTDPVLSAGYYANGLPGGTHSLNPGIYVLGPTVGGTDGWAAGGVYDGSAGGVMLYLLPGVTAEFSHATFMRFRAPDPTMGDNFPGVNTYAGIAVFQARSSALTNVTWSGTGPWSIAGTIYLPQTNVTIGTSVGAVPTQLVVNSMTVNSGGVIRIHYNGAFPGSGNFSRALVK